MHDDWGARCSRWAGIRSEQLDVAGTTTHLLRAEALPGVPDDAPTQLLVHGLGGSSGNWLEVIDGLRAHGPVVAPDLPGFGRTEPTRRRATRAASNARFLGQLADTLDLGSVVVHGNSMGGLLAVLYADLEPERVARLVLVSPALPGPLASLRRIAPRTLAQFVPFAVPPLGKAVLGWLWRRSDGASLWEETVDYIHGDPSRLAPEVAVLGAENVDFGRERPWRLDGFVTAASSIVAAMTVGQRSLGRAIDRVQPPTLLLWGDQDRLVGRAMIDHVAERRADWNLHVFETVGHAPQLEVPDDYLEVVGAWLGTRTDAAVGSAPAARLAS